MGRIAQETAKGLKWGMIKKFTLQPVQFIYGVILARLITPEEFGILGLTAIFFALAGQLENCGFGAALIRKQDRTQTDCSTVFWYTICTGALLSLLLFSAAPLFADFFHQPPLVNLTRASAILLFVNATTNVHQALYQARRDFKTPALIGLVSTLVAMPFTIWAAYSGWSYWALMAQGIISGTLSMVAYWIFSPWQPSLLWSNTSFREFFSFGIKLMFSGMLTTLYQEGRALIIGKFYSPAQLGNYNKGAQLVALSSDMMNSMLSGVIYPVLSTIQNDEQRLIAVYRKYIRLNNLVAQFLLLSFAFYSRPLILFLYGDAWEEAFTYAQILCCGYAINQLSGINSNLYMVKGRTDIILKINVILRIVSFAAMLGAAFISVTAFCYAAVLAAATWLILCLHYTASITSLSIRMQISDFSRYVLFAIIANLPAFVITQTQWPHYLQLLIGGALAFIIYLGLLLLRKDTTLHELCDLLRKTSLGARFLPKFL